MSNTKYLRRSNSVTIFIQTSAFVFECPIIRKKNRKLKRIKRRKNVKRSDLQSKYQIPGHICAGIVLNRAHAWVYFMIYGVDFLWYVSWHKNELWNVLSSDLMMFCEQLHCFWMDTSQVVFLHTKLLEFNESAYGKAILKMAGITFTK